MKRLLELENKSLGDIWLHVTPDKGPRASMLLGPVHSIVHRAIESAIHQQDAELLAELEAPIPEPLTFEEELRSVINRYSQENGSNTPDYILAEYLINCLKAFNCATQTREVWYGREAIPAPPPAPTQL